MEAHPLGDIDWSAKPMSDPGHSRLSFVILHETDSRPEATLGSACWRRRHISTPYPMSRHFPPIRRETATRWPGSATTGILRAMSARFSRADVTTPTVV